MITMTHVTKRFAKFAAVNDVSLTLAPGESVALWGANGAGKTTLIRCVLGLLSHQGEITIGGRDARRDAKSARMLVGYVPQELAFHDDLAVDEAIAFFARLKGLRAVRPADALASVGLADHASKRIRELSGGMKQRLALAIALLGDPPVLILDEVTASLDAVGREEFVSLLAGLSGAGRTMLFASHRVDEVAALSRRVALLDKGRLTGVLPCARFAAEINHGAALHLVIPAPSRDRAIVSLRTGGFDPRVNGVGVIVPVAPEQKAGPFRVLAEARIQVDDFEIVSLAQAQRLAAPHHTSTEARP